MSHSLRDTLLKRRSLIIEQIHNFEDKYNISTIELLMNNSSSVVGIPDEDYSEWLSLVEELVEIERILVNIPLCQKAELTLYDNF